VHLCSSSGSLTAQLTLQQLQISQTPAVQLHVTSCSMLRLPLAGHSSSSNSNSSSEQLERPLAVLLSCAVQSGSWSISWQMHGTTWPGRNSSWSAYSSTSMQSNNKL
jgi:hypothetical protein